MTDQQLLAISTSQHHQLERICASADGRVKALFEDNAVVHLTSSADCFVYVAPDGSRINQLTDYCLHKYFPRLQPVLAYRNQYVCDVPRFCPSFLQSLPADSFSSLGYPILEAAWPSTVEVAFQRHVAVLHEEDSVAVHSLCGTAFAQLDLSGCRFKITCQLLVSAQPGAQQYHYVEHTQHWPPHACPARWQPVLTLLQAITDNATAGFPLSPAATSPATSPKKQRKGHDQAPGSPAAAAAAGGGFYDAYPGSSSPDLTSSSILTHFLTPLPISPDLLLTLPTSSSSPPTAVQYSNNSSGPPLALTWVRPGTTSSSSGGGGPRHRTPLPHPPTPAAAAAAALAAARAAPPNSSASNRDRGGPGSPRPLSRMGRTSSTAGSSSSVWRDGSRSPRHRPSSPQQQFQPQQQQQASRVATAVAASYSVDPWWTSQTPALPSDQLLVLMWTPGAVYLFDAVRQEVVTWVGPPCESAIVSQQRGSFMQHYIHGEGAPRGYVATLPPKHITYSSTQQQQQQQRLAVGMLVATAFRFRNAMVAVMAAGAAQGGPPHSSRGISQGAAAAAGPSRRMAGAAGQPQGASFGDTAAAAVLEVAAAKAAALQQVRDTAAAAAAAAGSSAGGGPHHLSHSSSSRERLALGSPPPPTSCLSLPPFDSSQTQEMCRSLLDQDVVDPWGGWHGRPLAPEEVARGLSLSEAVVEVQEVEGAGEFTAYADGRIRVRFCDRTLLWMDAPRATARLLLRDATWAQVAVGNPLGVEAYVQAAWEFAAWAFKTPEQRAQELRLAALVQAELEASARMATLCEWAAVTSRPATSARRRGTAATAAAAAGGGRPATAPNAAGIARNGAEAAGGGGGFSSRSRPATPVGDAAWGSLYGGGWGSGSSAQGVCLQGGRGAAAAGGGRRGAAAAAAAAAGALPEAAAATAGKRLTYREREVLVGQALQDTQLLLQRLLQ